MATSRRFRVAGPRAAPWSTDVVVASGALAQASRDVARRYRGARVVVVSDATVARLYGRAFTSAIRRAGASALLLSFPAGERAKTRETKSRLEDRLVGKGVGRDCVVVALGGGVTIDLAGFLAATWHRGVPFVAIPTTLLAMVDAALGGKTAVDLPGGKNLVGAFHQPDALWADVRTLSTLPHRVFRAGLAEAVKTAAMCDAALFRRMELGAAQLARRDAASITGIVSRCLALKGAVVAGDPFDAGRRAVLNFGHTAAHAIEAASGYRIAHGDAVAMGLVVESRLACRFVGHPPAHAARIEALLRTFGLPVAAPHGLDPERLLRAAQRDKKTRGGVVRCALPVRIGRAITGDDPTVSVDAVRDLLPLIASN